MHSHKPLASLLGGALIVALFSSVALAAPGGLKKPSSSNSTLTGTVSGTPYDAGTTTPGSVDDGVVVFEMKDAGTATLLSIRVPNTTITDAGAVLSEECTGDPDVEWNNDGITVKGIACNQDGDNGTGGTVTVTFDAGVNTAVEGSYPISAAYRTVQTPPRKNGNMYLVQSTATLEVATP